MYGSCVRSNKLAYSFAIPLERTHGPWRPYIPIMGGLMRKMVDGTISASLFYPAI